MNGLGKELNILDKSGESRPLYNDIWKETWMNWGSVLGDLGNPGVEGKWYVQDRPIGAKWVTERW